MTPILLNLDRKLVSISAQKEFVNHVFVQSCDYIIHFSFYYYGIHKMDNYSTPISNIKTDTDMIREA